MPTTAKKRPKAVNHAKLVRDAIDAAHHQLHAATTMLSGSVPMNPGAPRDTGRVFAAMVCVEQARQSLDSIRDNPMMVAMRDAIGPALEAYEGSRAAVAAVQSKAGQRRR